VPESSSAVHRYHDGTKHHFNRFARALGYLDWATQPNPFRHFAGSPRVALYPRPDAGAGGWLIGDLLRHSLGLSAWKVFGRSRWSLRVNPSSGNLHPTEAYVVCGPASGLAPTPAVFHYAADVHELELRCAFGEGAWQSAARGDPDLVLIILSSIHWRESWKYGERAFRYCQHDLGHAIAAVAVAAAACGCRALVLPGWGSDAIATAAGLDRDRDFVEAEREEPGCVIAIMREGTLSGVMSDWSSLVRSIADGEWHGRASQLSADHVQWTFIDEVADATRLPEDPDRSTPTLRPLDGAALPSRPAAGRSLQLGSRPDIRSLVLRRRSAVAFDGVTGTTREDFLELLAAAMPEPSVEPWQALGERPRIHLVLFVHRVADVHPGLYMLVRDRTALEPLRTVAQRDFLWQPVDEALPLFLLAQGDCRRLAKRVSCDQDIAADGFFSMGMIAEFDGSLTEAGPSCYRRLFWESGVVGQVLYLQAEALGARATGIGCFYDDPVHEVLGLQGHAFQSLYHFTIGRAVEDARLTTEPGYPWDREPHPPDARWTGPQPMR
jgi:SagB-type dehydrogenase family enzyme